MNIIEQLKGLFNLQEDFSTPYDSIATLKIGDVLGRDYGLPENLDHLKGWLVYNFTDEGVPQILESKASALKGTVCWKRADNHVKETLPRQGHKNTRLWTDADHCAIFNNIVEAGLNGKVKLTNNGNWWNGYWGSSTDDSVYPAAITHCLQTYNTDWPNRDNGALTRAVQDVPELASKTDSKAPPAIH